MNSSTLALEFLHLDYIYFVFFGVIRIGLSFFLLFKLDGWSTLQLIGGRPTENYCNFGTNTADLSMIFGLL